MPPTAIPEKFLDLFQKPAFAHLVTLMPDGSPQVTPVWIDYVDGLILLTTAAGRQKERNVRRDPRVALSIQDPADPYRYLQVRGRVVEVTTAGAEAHIDKMAFKYTGSPVYQWRRPGQVRVMLKIQPETVTA